MTNGGLSVSRINQIFGDFIVGEILLAFEQKGILGAIADGSPFSARTVAERAGVDGDGVLAACDFLVEQGICEKLDADRYRLTGAYDDLRGPVNYFLTYKPLYESLVGLLDGSKRYGRDINRNEMRYLRCLDAITAHSFPFLLGRITELGARRITGIGATALGFLRIVSEELRPDACSVVVSREEREELEREENGHLRFFDPLRIVSGEPEHPERFLAEAAADVVLGIAVFHDIHPEDQLLLVLGRYKKAFPQSRLFLLEFDAPRWDEVRDRGASSARHVAAVSRFTHALKRESGQRPSSEWARIIEGSGWYLAHAQRFESGLVIYECS